MSDLTLNAFSVLMVEGEDFDRLVFEVFGRPYSAQVGNDYCGDNTVYHVQFFSPTEEPALYAMFNDDLVFDSEAYQKWIDAEIPDGLQDQTMEWYEIENLSPPISLIAHRLRERGVVIPDDFYVHITI